MDGSLSFDKPWNDYKNGFGNHESNFWMGLELIHQKTSKASYRLRLEFSLQNGSWYSAEYNSFRLENETNFYRIHMDGYSGDGDDVMNSRCSEGVSNGMNFTTFDRDNDNGPYNCAGHYGGGWWFNRCLCVNLNRIYGGNYGVWMNDWHRLTASRMMMKLN